MAAVADVAAPDAVDKAAAEAAVKTRQRRKSLLSSVGALYERPLFLESTKYGRS